MTELQKNMQILDWNEFPDDRWDSFVESHPLGWLYHTSAWRHILQTTFHHINPLYLVKNSRKTGQIEAALPLCHVKSRFTGNRLVSLPFATLCDPLVVSGDQFEILFNRALQIKNRLQCKYLEVRVFQGSAFVTHPHLSVFQDHVHHWLSLEEEPQTMMKRFHRSCVRQRITRASKSDIDVYEGRTEKDLLEFYRLYVKTRRRLCLPPQPYKFIKNIWQILSPLGRITLLMANKNGLAIGSIILLKYKDRVSAEYAAFDEEYLDLSPNHLLFWTAIQNAQKGGYRIFDFGRTSLDNKGLLDFKRRWGTHEMYLGQAFFPPHVTRSSVQASRITRQVAAFVFGKIPEPTFRTLGKFVYRHLG